jgi:hypothetical protein
MADSFADSLDEEVEDLHRNPELMRMWSQSLSKALCKLLYRKLHHIVQIRSPELARDNVLCDSSRRECFA